MLLVVMTFIGIFAASSCFGQIMGENGYMQWEIRHGDTVLVTYLKEIHLPIAKKGALKIKPQYREYLRLQRYVKKVYPYALLAASKLKEYQVDLDASKSDSERRRVMKKVEKALVDKYGAEMKNLTINQGQILLKLIDRETGRSSYELLSEMRGAFPAVIWQGLASIFGQNLKSTFDAKGEDKDIEEIILKIQRGLI
jgi:hypothetical protein